MTYTCHTPIIKSTKNPIHLIKRTKTSTIWEGVQLWLDLEEGSKDPEIPLTKALRLNIVNYIEGFRQEVGSFKITNIDTLMELNKTLASFIKEWQHLNSLEINE